MPICSAPRLRRTLFLAAATLLSACSALPSSGPDCAPVPPAVAASLPSIDGFMIDKDDHTQYSSWLGRKLADGRLMREPINLVVIDPVARSDEEAARRLVDAFSRAGFAPRAGHTSGYLGRIDGVLHGQQPAIKDFAFSDYMWAFTNNHARLFGPHQGPGGRIWIGASSREKGVAHDYVSFSRSRDAMRQALVAHADARHLGCLPLRNRLDTPTEQTGDHDGHASVLRLQ